MSLRRRRSREKINNQSVTYFHPRRSRKKTRSSFKKGVLAGFYLILIALFIYVVFYSPLFQIKSLLLSGNKTVSSAEIKKVARLVLDRPVWLVLPNNLVLLNKEEIKNNLLDNFPRIDSLKIKRKFLNQIKIEISEKRGLVVWCRSYLSENQESEEISEIKNCYLVDGNGLAYSQIADFNQRPGDLPLVEDKLTNPIIFGESVANSEFISFVFRVQEILPRMTDLEVIKLDTPSAQTKELYLTTNENWQIYFDTTRSAEEQVRILNRLLQEKISPEERKNLEYIDLRIENRAYYK